MSEHWEFVVKFPNQTVKTFGGKSKGGGGDPTFAAQHVAEMAPFKGCTVTARYLGDSDSHVSIGFKQRGQKKTFRMVHKKPTTRMMFNSGGQQVNRFHQVLTKSDKGRILVSGSPEHIFESSSSVVGVIDSSDVDLPTATINPQGIIIPDQVEVPEPTEEKKVIEATAFPEAEEAEVK